MLNSLYYCEGGPSFCGQTSIEKIKKKLLPLCKWLEIFVLDKNSKAEDSYLTLLHFIDLWS